MVAEGAKIQGWGFGDSVREGTGMRSLAKGECAGRTPGEGAVALGRGVGDSRRGKEGNKLEHLLAHTPRRVEPWTVKTCY